MAPKRTFFKGFFCNFLGINIHTLTLSKMTQNLKIRAYLMQNFMELDMKKFSYPKALTFGVLDLKTSLGQFRLQFSETGDLIFLRIMR